MEMRHAESHGTTVSDLWDYLEIHGTDGDDRLVVPANDDWNYVEAYTGSDLIEVDAGDTGHVVVRLTTSFQEA